MNKRQCCLLTRAPGVVCHRDRPLTSQQLLFTPRLRAPSKRPRIICANAKTQSTFSGPTPRSRPRASARTSYRAKPSEHARPSPARRGRPRNLYPQNPQNPRRPSQLSRAAQTREEATRRTTTGLVPCGQAPGRGFPVLRGWRERCQWLPSGGRSRAEAQVPSSRPSSGDSGSTFPAAAATAAEAAAACGGEGQATEMSGDPSWPERPHCAAAGAPPGGGQPARRLCRL